MRLSRSHLALVPTAAILLACSSDGTGPDADQLLDILFNYCSTPPTFAAIQTEAGGAWTAIGTPDATGKVTVQLPEKFGVVEVFQSGAAYSTYVYYMQRDQLAIPASCPSATLKTVNGSITPALTGAQEAQVTIDARSAFLFAGTTNFQITQVRDGSKDLLAQRRVGTGNNLADKVIVLRSQNPAAGSTMAALDFAAAPAPASATLTLTGLTSAPSVFGQLYTVNNGLAFFNSPSASSSSATVYGLPAASVVATDMHIFGVFASSGATSRGVDLHRRTVGDATVAVGPVLSTPTVTVTSTTPNKRLRMQLASQTDYGALVQFTAYQSGVGFFRQVGVLTTSAYLGSTPATWDVQIPDFSTITGFPAAAILTNIVTDWDAYAQSDASTYFKATTDVTDNTASKWALIESTVAVRQMGGTLSGAEKRAPGGRIRR